MFFNTVPVVGDFFTSFIVVVDDGVSRSVDLFIFVIFVLDVWCMVFTHGGMFCVCRNFFLNFYEIS